MTVIDVMSYDTFTNNIDAIRTEVRTILGTTGNTRRRFRIVALYDKGTGDPLGEIVRTSFGPVLAYTGMDWSEPNEPINGRRIVGFRRSRHLSSLEPITGSDDQFFQIKSRSTWLTLRWQHIRSRTSPGGLVAYR